MWIEEKETKKGLAYIYRERFNDTQGNAKKVSITLFSNSTQAQKKAQRLLYEKIALALDESKENYNRSITFRSVAMDWLEHTKPTIKYNTHLKHVRLVKKLINYLVGNTPIFDVSALAIERLLYDEYYTKNKSIYHAKSLLFTAKAIFRHAKRRGLIKDIAPIEELSIKQKPQSAKDIKKRQDKFLDRDELKEALRQLHGINPRIALIMEFISRTGLRIGELLAIRECDYNSHTQTVNINGTICQHIKNSDENKRGTPKNIYSVRDVTLDKRAIEIIKIIRAENQTYKWFPSFVDNGYIFVTKRGAPYDQQFIGKQLRKLSVNDKHITSHAFRHTHISMLAELGVPLKAIMQRVGHNDPKTTLSIYTHVSNSMNDELMRKLETV